MDTTQSLVTTSMPSMPGVTSEDVEKALTIGDIGKMPAEVRMKFYLAVCASAGLNPLTRPLTPFKGQDGQIFLYANAQCTEQLRSRHRLSIRTLAREKMDGLYIVTVEGRLPDGRTEESQGIVEISALKGTALANAMMKAETKAKRRLTLAMCGLGFAFADDSGADESEIRLDMQTGELIEKSDGVTIRQSTTINRDEERRATLASIGAWMRTFKSAVARAQAIDVVFSEPLTPADIQKLDTDRLAVALGVLGIAAKAGVDWSSKTLAQDLAQARKASARQAMEDLGFGDADMDPRPQKEDPTTKHGHAPSNAAEDGRREPSPDETRRNLEILRTYQADERLPEALLERIKYALSDDDRITDIGLAQLASTVIDHLPNHGA